MKTNNQTVLLISAGVLLIIVGGLWYLTHQPVPYPEAESLATTTAQLASTTSSNTTTTTTHTTSVSPTPVTHTPPANGGTVAVSTNPPHITEFVPAAGSAGTQITIKGSDFDRTSNTITFGTSGGRHRSDGTPDNVIAAVASTDGKTLIFTVPTTGPSGLLCDVVNKCVAISATQLQSGTYPVTVHNKNGTSNIVSFTLIH